MIDQAKLAADPQWLPHAIDAGARSVTFLRVSPALLRSGVFLASLRNLPSAKASFDQVREMKPVAGPIGFICHSGFCLSTLLAKAIDVPGVTAVLNEPGILNCLSQLEEPDDALVGSIVNLLSRTHVSGTTVVVKPSNFVNGLVPQLLKVRPDARAVLMTNTARHFLEAVVRKGLKGRQWGRQVYLHAATYVGPVFPLDMKGCAGLTDLQLSGMGWLLTQYWFHKLLSGPDGGRLAVLHGEAFDARRDVALGAVGAHLGLTLSADAIGDILAGTVFRLDAKTGIEFAPKQAEDAARARSVVTDEEIDEVAGMLASNARLLGIEAPLPHTLF